MKRFVWLLGFFLLIVLLGACKTLPTALSAERQVYIPEIDTDVIVSKIQYDLPRFSRSDNPNPLGPFSYKPSEKGKCLAVLSIQIQNVRRNERIDFYGITVENDTAVHHPVAAKYFENNFQIGTNWTFLETKNEKLGFNDMSDGVRSVLLLYECSPGQRFDKVNFYGIKTVKLESETSDKFVFSGRCFE